MQEEEETDRLLELVGSEDPQAFKTYLETLLEGRDREQVKRMMAKSRVMHAVVRMGRLDYLQNLLHHGNQIFL